MPIYEYHCKSCDSEFETFVRNRDAEPDACPECDAEKIERLISNTSFKLKGSGWYETDYADDGDGSSGSGGDASDDSTANGSDDAASDGSAGSGASAAGESTSANETDAA
jgi:putative FmdB family regulatory protein